MQRILFALCAALVLVAPSSAAGRAAPAAKKPAPRPKAAREKPAAKTRHGRSAAGRQPRQSAAPAAPQPAPPKAAAPEPLQPGWRPEPARPWELLEKVTVEVTRVDSRQSTLAGRDRVGREQVFRFGPGTLVRRLDPASPTRLLSEVGGEGLPVKPHQQVMVTWKEDRVTGERIAVQLTTP